MRKAVKALTLLVSGYPDVQSAMAAILLEADEIIVKPFAVGRLAELVREKVLNRRPTARLAKDRVGGVLQRCVTSIVEGWTWGASLYRWQGPIWPTFLDVLCQPIALASS
jgi:hypothetical protein